jgi:acyl carrier protein
MVLQDQLCQIFRQVFDDDEIVLEASMTANDIDGWDSLSHVNLIVAVEAGFNIRFTQKELLTLKDVGDLLQTIGRKIGA